MSGITKRPTRLPSRYLHACALILTVAVAVCAAALTGLDTAHAQSPRSSADSTISPSDGSDGNPGSTNGQPLSVRDACFRPQDLKSRRGEELPRKRIRTFDKAEAARELVPFSPIPDRLRGAIRRVNLPPGKKLVALTLDLCEQNGEIAGYDGRIIDYLRQENIKATLFVGGKWLRSHDVRTRQLMADPLFEIANHSAAHRNLRLLSGKRLSDEIAAPQRAYEAIYESMTDTQCVQTVPRQWSSVPKRMSLFRFPFGACNQASLDAVNDAGLLAIQWDVSTGDPSPRQSANAITRQILRATRPGSIIIAHANGRGFHTAQALPQAIPKLKAKGYTFVTVSELIAAGTPQIVATCYNIRPGDTDRYDNLATAFRKDLTSRRASTTGSSNANKRKPWKATVKAAP